MIQRKVAFAIFLFILFQFPNQLESANILILPDTTVQTGENFQFPLYLSNSDSITGYQFDLKIPPEIEYGNDFIISNRHRDHQVFLQMVDSVTLRALCFSTSKATLKDTAGPILSIRLKSGERSGRFPFLIENAILVSSQNENVLDSLKSGSVTVRAPLKIKTNSEESGKKSLRVYPNPLNNSARIQFYSDRPASVSLLLLNSLGQKVENIFLKPAKAGWNEINLDTTPLASGVYYLKYISQHKVCSSKISIIK